MTLDSLPTRLYDKLVAVSSSTLGVFTLTEFVLGLALVALGHRLLCVHSNKPGEAAVGPFSAIRNGEDNPARSQLRLIGRPGAAALFRWPPRVGLQVANQ